MSGEPNFENIENESQNQEKDEVEFSKELPGKENLKNELLQEGLKAEDIAISISLAENIRELDFLVFGKNIPIVFADFECEQDKEIKAFYAPRARKQKESYIIYVPKMKECLEGAHFYFDEQGKLTNEKTDKPITVPELLVQIAAHEVRHRFQQKLEIKRKVGKKKSVIEYDSHLVEFAAVEAFHAGKTMEEIAELIK